MRSVMKPPAVGPQPSALRDQPPALTPEGYAKARRYLMRRDPVLGAAIKKIGACGMADRQRKDHLSALVGSIVSQQLSTKAASTIFSRFLALFPDGHISDAAAIAAHSDAYATLLADVPDADLRAQVDGFDGGKTTRGALIVNLILCGCAAYRTQLFLYLKACGREELGTMNLWAGADAPAAV